MAPQASEVHRRAERRLQCLRRSPHGLRSGGHPQQFHLHSLCCLNNSSLQLPRFPPHSASVTPLLFDSSELIYAAQHESRTPWTTRWRWRWWAYVRNRKLWEFATWARLFTNYLQWVLWRPILFIPAMLRLAHILKGPVHTGLKSQVT